MEKKVLKTKNVYLSAFLVTQENFTLGKVYIDDLEKDNKAWIEIEYDEQYQALLDNYVDLYNKKRAVCKLNAYQDNMRFIMHLVNTRKSGINEELNDGK